MLAVLACQDNDAPPALELDRATAEAAAEALVNGSSAPPGVDRPDISPHEAPHEGTAPTPTAAAPQVVPQGAQLADLEPVQVVLVWQGISALYKGFFMDSGATTGLSVGLAGAVQAPANVYIRYDSEEFVGTIRLQLRPDTLRLAVGRDGGRLSLNDLAPITQALASYRSAVASHYDIRVESFRVGIESFRGPTSCVFGVAGSPPPDGRLVSPCVLVSGVEHCGTPQAQGVHFEPAVAKDIARCLDL